MSLLRMRLCAAVAVVVSAVMPSRAQEPRTAEVKGKLESEQELILHGYIAELDGVIHPGETRHTDVAADGSFSFRNVTYGDYVLRITDYYGNAFAEQFVSIRETQAPVEVKLPRNHTPRPASERVSLRELQHPPVPKAMDAMRAGQRFAQSGRYEKAADEWRKAVRLSPDYAPAHSNLAVQYIRLQQYDQALAEIGRAVEIAGPNPADLSNLAFVRTALGQYGNAAAAAREALRLDPNYASAHYILGTLLLGRPETREEGIAHLQRAAATLPSARASLEHLQSGR